MEGAGGTGGEEGEVGLREDAVGRHGAVGEAFPVHHVEELTGDGRGRVDEPGCLRAVFPGIFLRDLLQGSQQEGIMRSAQDDGVGAGFEQGQETGPDGQLGPQAAQFAALD